MANIAYTIDAPAGAVTGSNKIAPNLYWASGTWAANGFTAVTAGNEIDLDVDLGATNILMAVLGMSEGVTAEAVQYSWNVEADGTAGPGKVAIMSCTDLTNNIGTWFAIFQTI